MDKKRITPDQVVEAYLATGLVPIRDGWTDRIGDRRCGCGLTAVATQISEANYDRISNAIMEEYVIADLLDLSPKYVGGFADGFDGGKRDPYESEDWQLGYEDGRSAWEAVKHLRDGVLA